TAGAAVIEGRAAVPPAADRPAAWDSAQARTDAPISTPGPRAAWACRSTCGRRRPASADEIYRSRGWQRRSAPGSWAPSRCQAPRAVRAPARARASRRHRPCRRETPTAPPSTCRPAVGRSAGGHRRRPAPRRRPAAGDGRPAAAARPDTPRRSLRSRTIAAVDVDVAVRQIAGPHGGAPAADAEIDVDHDVGALDVLDDRRLVVVGHDLAVVGDADAADGGPALVAVVALAGLADRHDDAAPVGVFACDRGLDQRRVGDRQADLARRSVGRRAADIDGDELARTLAVARQKLRQLDQQLI